jgi:hypothetical protein
MKRRDQFEPYGVPTITGPLFAQPKRGPVDASADELAVAFIIMEHVGAADPVSIKRICAETSFSPRQVKGIVERLVVDHKMKIGARREEPFGYFTIESAADLEEAAGPYRAQILSMWRRLRVLESRQAMRELHGQLRIDEDNGHAI